MVVKSISLFTCTKRLFSFGTCSYFHAVLRQCSMALLNFADDAISAFIFPLSPKHPPLLFAKDALFVFIGRNNSVRER